MVKTQYINHQKGRGDYSHEFEKKMLLTVVESSSLM